MLRRSTPTPGQMGANFWRLFAASAATNLGDGVRMLAYPWLATAITRDPLKLSLVTVATSLPWLLFSLPAGALVDRSDRRRLVVFVNLAHAVVAVLIAALVVVTDLPAGGADWQLVVLAGAVLALGCGEVVRDTATQALVPAVVSTDRLEQATGRLLSIERLTNEFVGAPLAGVLLAAAVTLPFLADAALVVAAALLVAGMPGTFRAEFQSPASDPAGGRTSVVEGLRWLWRQRVLRDIAIVAGLVSLANRLAFATFVYFSQEILGLGAAGYGLLGTSFAAGAVVGGMLASRARTAVGPGGITIAALAWGGVATALVGLVSQVVIVWIAMFTMSLLTMVWNVTARSLRLRVTPDRLQGRVASSVRFITWGVGPIGLLVGSALVRIVEFGAERETALRAPLLIGAAAHVPVVLVAVRRLNNRVLLAAEHNGVRTEEPGAGTPFGTGGEP